MTRALVLSGGGPVGIAWEAGLLAGLEEEGVELGAADYILGTSAGSFVGSQLAMGRKARDLAASILAEADRVSPAAAPSGQPGGQPSGGARPSAMGVLVQLMQAARSGERDPQEARRAIGKFALDAETMEEDAFIRSFGRQLSEGQADAWPQRNFACTAVDAESGEFVVWSADSKIGLARAVASSCSVPGVYPPITINGRRYIDGGMRSGSNADLAAGHDLVVVVGLRAAAADPEMAARMRAPLEKELQVLRDGGARAELILPDDASVAAFGLNLMDGRARPAAAKAGMAQGRALAAELKRVWG